ncbi:MAG: NAD+ synthase [Candidatus Marinimicrobia bacterium]|nr:NAD+ synthase [Candidatus Neomarinimicrobiota bacterium]
MKITLCQVNPIVGNLKNNTDLILKYYSKCLESNANIIVFPEMVITGYPPQDLLWEPGFIDQNLSYVSHIAANTSKPLILGYVRKKDDKLYNSAAVCFEGKIQSVIDKILLPSYDVFDEDRYFSSGESPKIISIPCNGKNVKIGIQICEDLWDHEYDCKVSQIQKNMGAEVLINISASPYHDGRLIRRKDLIQEKVKETGLPILYCNMVGSQDELIFDGESLAFDANGNCLGQGKPFKEDIISIDLNSNKRVEIQSAHREEKMYRALCLGVSDYFFKTGHKEAVLGLSGGIDSALVASIAADALGPENVHGISLPSKYSSDHSLSDAKGLAQSLGIDYRIIPIQEAVEGIETVLHPHFLRQKSNVTEENIQARVRGNLLMALSNKFGWMVLSTGNKTELALGYCTLYGDMSGGLAVISDLSKTDVYAIANWVNTQKPERIPEGSILKPPSAELAPNQVDPFDYDIVSPLVDAIVEERKSPLELVQNGAESELVNSLYQKIRFNEYKRRQSAPGLRVSSKAFGLGRRVPIVNHYKGRF